MAAAKGVKKKSETKKQKKSCQTLDIDGIFEKMDLNHDGRISVRELTKAAQLIGLNPTYKEAEQMIADCDPAQKGYVTKTEFKKLFSDRQHEIDEQVAEITKAFKVFDKDDSGTISADEVRKVLRACGEDIDESELNEMIKSVDIDGDGIISIEEFAMVMCDANFD